MPSPYKYKGFKSDGGSASHTESLTRDFLSAANEGQLGLNRRLNETRAAKDAWLEATGRPKWTQTSRECACGKPALRVWMNVGYCKTCEVKAYAATKRGCKR